MIQVEREVRIPDGRIVPVLVPENATDRQIMAFAKKMYEEGRFDTVGERSVGQDVADFARTAIGQGAMFGFGDEIEAAVRSALPESIGGGEYEDIRNKLRQELKAYKEANPATAITGELAGALVPTIIATIMTGGAAAPATMTRIAGIGAAEGAAYGAGTSESEDLGGLARDTATGAGIGFVTGPAVMGATRLVTGGADKFLTFVRSKLGDKASDAVQKELRRLQEQTGKSTEQIIEDLNAGRIMAANKTLAIALKNYVAEGGEAGAETLSRAKAATSEAREQAESALERELAPTQGQQATEQFAGTQKQMKDASSAAYDDLFESIPENEVPFAVANQMLSAVRRLPSELFDELNQLYTLRGIVPLFRKDINGAIEMVRAPTLRDAEVMRRRLDQSAKKLFQSGSGDMGEVVSDMAGNLRKSLDEASPELAATRANYKTLMDRNEAFKLGSLALNKNLDDIETAVRDMSDRPEVLEAFRLGLLRQIRDKAAGQKTTFGKLADEETKQGEILRVALRGADIRDLERKLGLAGELQEITAKLPDVAGSPTALLQREAKRSGAGASLQDLAIMSGDGGIMQAIPAIGRIVEQIMGKGAPKLTDAERMRVVNILFERDPELVRKALTDNTALEALVDKYSGIIGTMAGGLRRGTVQQTAGEDSPIR